MSKNWTYASLGEACQIKPPKKEAKERLEKMDLVSFVPMQDLGVREKYFSPTEDKPFGKIAGSYTYFADGDVLLAKITPCFENGKLGIARGLTNGIGFGSSEFIVFRSRGALEPEFLFYYLSQNSFRDAGQRVMSGAVGHKRVPKEFIDSHVIPLPPLPEQKRIVAILDEAFAGIDAAIANTEKNLANARELFESYLNAAFRRFKYACVERQLADVVDLISGQHIDKKDYNTERQGIGYLTGPADFGKRHPTVSKWTESPKRRAKKGDILITVKGSGVGKLNMMTEPELAISRQLMAIRAKHINSEFLYAFLSLNKRYFQDLSNGAAIPGISRDDVLKLSIPVPMEVDQNELIASLSEVSAEVGRLERGYERKISALAELKQSLLQKAFSGELTSEGAQEEMEEALA